MELYIKQILTQGRVLLAGDHTAWSCPDAVTLKERTIEHSNTARRSFALGVSLWEKTRYRFANAGNKPITIGQGYSTIAWIPEDSLS